MNLKSKLQNRMINECYFCLRLKNFKNRETIIILIKMHIEDKASSIFSKVIIVIVTSNFIKNKLEKKKSQIKIFDIIAFI